MDFFTVQTVN